MIRRFKRATPNRLSQHQTDRTFRLKQQIALMIIPAKLEVVISKRLQFTIWCKYFKILWGTEISYRKGY